MNIKTKRVMAVIYYGVLSGMALFGIYALLRPSGPTLPNNRSVWSERPS